MCSEDRFHETFTLPQDSDPESVQKEMCKAATQYEDLTRDIVNSFSFEKMLEELVKDVRKIIIWVIFCKAGSALFLTIGDLLI